MTTDIDALFAHNAEIADARRNLTAGLPENISELDKATRDALLWPRRFEYAARQRAANLERVRALSRARQALREAQEAGADSRRRNLLSVSIWAATAVRWIREE